MKESPVLEHWGRLQKKEDDSEKAKGIGEEGEDENEDDEAPSLVEQAKQVDLKAINAVLKVCHLSPLWTKAVIADSPFPSFARHSTTRGTSSSTMIPSRGTNGSRST